MQPGLTRASAIENIGFMSFLSWKDAVLINDGLSQPVRHRLVTGLVDFQVRSGQSLLAKAWPLINFRPTEVAKALSMLTGPKAPKPG